MASEVQPQHGHHRLGMLHGARYATLADLELALEAALSVNQHLNQEIESVLQRIQNVERERDAWQQRAQQLARQLAKERLQRHSIGGVHSVPSSRPASAAVSAVQSSGGGPLRPRSTAGGTTPPPAATAAGDGSMDRPTSAAEVQLADALASADPGTAAAALTAAGDAGGVPAAAAAVAVSENGSIPHLNIPWEGLAGDVAALAAKGKAAGWLATPADVVLGPLLGSGAFGTTYRATWRGADVAVKCVRVESGPQLTNFLREVEVLAGVRHPHVVPFLGACLQGVDSFWLISEYMPRGTLSEWLHNHKGPMGPSTPLTERLTRALEVASALAAMEGCRPPLLHRDVKPANVFLDGAGAARLGDFGLARPLPASRATLTGETGTYLYMSPEMVRHEVYDSKTDVWSFGVLLAEMVTGMHPYQDTYMTPVQVAMGVADEKLQPWLPDSAPAGLQALAAACCDFDPEMRPSFELVVAELSAVIQEIKEHERPSNGGGLFGRLISSGGLPLSWTSVLAPLATSSAGAS